MKKGSNPLLLLFANFTGIIKTTVQIQEPSGTIVSKGINGVKTVPFNTLKG